MKATQSYLLREEVSTLVWIHMLEKFCLYASIASFSEWLPLRLQDFRAGVP